MGRFLVKLELGCCIRRKRGDRKELRVSIRDYG